MRKWLTAALIVALSFAPAISSAAEKPFFRMGPASAQSTGPTDPEPEGPLAFSRAEQLPATVTVGQAVSRIFTSTGGKTPHELSGNGLPNWLSVSRTGAQSWTLSGTATAPGAYAASSVELTDDAGGNVAFALVGVTVIAGPESGALTISALDPSLEMPPVAGTGESFNGEEGGTGAAYMVSGGRAPYTMALENGPSGLFLDDYSQFFGQPLFVFNGAATPAGPFPTMRLVATDADGKKGYKSLPFEVSGAGPALAFDANRTEDPEETNVAPQVAISGVYYAKGGIAPYSMDLIDTQGTGIPQVTKLKANPNDPKKFDLTAAILTPGTYSGLRVRLTDSAGGEVFRSLPPITVTDNGSIAMSFVKSPNLPTPLDAGDTLPELEIQVAGLEDADYSWVEFEYGTAPRGITIEEIDSSQGRYKIVGYPQEAGVFNDITVIAGKETTDGERKQISYTMPPVTTTTTNMPPMTIARQFNSYSWNWEFDAMNGVTARGQVSGGSGEYTATLLSGSLPAGTQITTGGEMDSGSYNVFFRSQGATPGSYGPTIIRVSDGHSTIDFNPVSMTVAASPLTCSGPDWTDLTVQPGSSTELAGYISGGVAPYSVSVQGNVPAALGITLTQPVYWSGNYRYGVSMAPTGKATALNSNIVVTDGQGQTCRTPLQATSYDPETDLSSGATGFTEVPLCAANGQAEGFRTSVINGVTHVYRDVGYQYQALFCLPNYDNLPDEYVNGIQWQILGGVRDEDPWRGINSIYQVSFPQRNGRCEGGCEMKFSAVGPDGQRFMTRTYIAVGNPNADGD